MPGFLTRLFGSANERTLRRLWPVVEEVNGLEESYRALPDEAFPEKTAGFRQRLAGVEAEDAAAALEDILPEAFAAVREASRRTIGLRHFDSQLLGGIVLHQGKIAEMKTGEGKTLVATMPLYLNALTGRGAHLVTVNDYLASRDREWMGEIYKFLGLTVGCIQNQMDPAARRLQYQCDIAYGTNNEFGFDYLRDNMAVVPEQRVQRGFVYAIVDEVDSVLIDEARTPLIISGPVEHSDQAFDELKPLVEKVVRSQLSMVNGWLAEAEKLLPDPKQQREAGIQLLMVQRSAPRLKRFIKMLSDRPELKRLITSIELEYLRDKRM